MSQIKMGIVLSYITVFFVNLAGLISIPIIIRSLGVEMYGLYILVGSIVACISLLDMGMNNTINRFVAKYRALKDDEGERNFLGTVIIINVAVLFNIFLISFLIYQNISIFFRSSLLISEQQTVKEIFIYLSVIAVLKLINGFFAGYSAGYGKLIYSRAVSLISNIIRLLIVVCFFTRQGSIYFLVIMDLILTAIMCVSNIVYSRLHQNAGVTFKNIHMSGFKEIFTYSVWIFIFIFISQIQWQVGQILIGFKINTTAVAVYAVGIALGSYYGAFSTAISDVFITRTTGMVYGQVNPHQLTEQMIKVGRLSLVVLLLVLGGFIIYGSDFIELWVGEAYQGAWLIALLFMLAYTLPLIQGTANQILEAKKMFAFKCKTYLICLSLGMGLGYLLIGVFQIVGMAMGVCGGWLLAVIVMNFYYHNILHLNMMRFFLGVAKGIVPVFVVIMLFGYYSNSMLPNTWLNLFIKISLFTVAYLVLIYRWGLTSEEKIHFTHLRSST